MFNSHQNSKGKLNFSLIIKHIADACPSSKTGPVTPTYPTNHPQSATRMRSKINQKPASQPDTLLCFLCTKTESENAFFSLNFQKHTSDVWPSSKTDPDTLLCLRGRVFFPSWGICLNGFIETPLLPIEARAWFGKNFIMSNYWKHIFLNLVFVF